LKLFFLKHVWGSWKRRTGNEIKFLRSFLQILLLLFKILENFWHLPYGTMERAKLVANSGTLRRRCLYGRHFAFVSVTCHGSSWHVASNEVVATYRAFSRERLRATVGAYVGLLHVNITLKGKKSWGTCRGKRTCTFFTRHPWDRAPTDSSIQANIHCRLWPLRLCLGFAEERADFAWGIAAIYHSLPLIHAVPATLKLAHPSYFLWKWKDFVSFVIWRKCTPSPRVVHRKYNFSKGVCKLNSNIQLQILS